MYLKKATVVGGKEYSIETGKIAKQADGAVIVRLGDTMVLVTAVGEKKESSADFFPLTVDYREYGYAAGRIPGGYFKREGKPTEKEILTSRLIDRPIRPLFAEGYKSETQVIAMVISADTDNDPDVLAITGASAALYLSDIPFSTPIAGVRVGLIDGQYVVNPTYSEQRASKLNLVVAGSEDAIVMVEAGAKEVSEAEIIEAIVFGHGEIRKLCQIQKMMREAVGKPKRPVSVKQYDPELVKAVEGKYLTRLREALDVRNKTKLQSYAAIEELKTSLVTEFADLPAEKQAELPEIFDRLKEKIFREDILQNRRRPDGRRFTEIRPISCEVGWLPRTHGSALFTRGETQAVVTATLGTKEDIQYVDDLEKGEVGRRFMLNYNFPPFSVGETGRMGAPGRREMGHGALAMRAIEPVIPLETEWPYTIRVVSDITESNGSSSMATICGGILALMDAGVPIKAPVAGVAMGLVMEGNKYAILTDIAGAEDHYGDMDFKVAGTRAGITALQMDIKVSGINAQIMSEALEQARQGRLFILNKMLETLAEPRKQLSVYAPRIFSIQISPEKIRDLIGPGGKVIKGLVERTGCKIDIEDSGLVHIASTNSEMAELAVRLIRELTAEVEVGKTYLGTVTRLAEFGAFVEILPGIEGLLHISELADYRVRNVRDELKEGQQLMVKCISVEANKIRLSRRAVLRDEKVEDKSERPERRSRR
ncbi:MAG: polyribonucleotide nucleotidyltransferase [Acidobacteriota bacterium]|nr:polyribonucleotide nucleotidyltransferase [Blastocatellia bacterium]MDW8412795.1 polyribonucleotide nucleotidyltransferase [Acidobacteriota bacterium]